MKTKRNILIFLAILITFLIGFTGYMIGYYQAKQEDKTEQQK